jgi:hypothetical protein
MGITLREPACPMQPMSVLLRFARWLVPAAAVLAMLQALKAADALNAELEVI